MFNLREYIKSGFLKAVGKMADYQIILNSAGFMEKGVLKEEDLAEIKAEIDKQYEKVEETLEEISGIEEIPEENQEISDENEEE